MESRNARKHAKWYASYMSDDQGVALINCMLSKIESLENLLDLISGEIELSESPPEENQEVVLNSIKCMIKQKVEVSEKVGFYEWTM